MYGKRHRLQHGLSQQGVWVPFWTPKPWKSTPQDTQFFLCGISKNLNLKLIIEFFHLLIIPMTLFNDIMPYFDEFIHVYGWNMSILWSPLKIWTPKNSTTANFRHPLSKSWLRHWTSVSETNSLQSSQEKNIFRSLCEIKTLYPGGNVISLPIILCGIFLHPHWCRWIGGVRRE